MIEPRIVVPLDGSELSERALPYAAALARATGSGLLLVTVWEGADRALVSRLPDLAEDLFQRGLEHYQQYLAGVAQRIEGAAVQAEVLTGEAADEIIRLIEERRARMLVVATHGRSGISRWLYGSVASKLAREAPVATLMVGPKALERTAAPFPIRRILVPLDGSEQSEGALGPAGELAAALSADIVLAQVLRWASQAFAFGVPDVDVARIDRELTQAAEQYLSQASGRLVGVTVETRVLRGMPVDALIDLVEKERIDLVVMTSHTRAGLARVALGSVADRMLQGQAPVLLVRP